MYIFVRVLVCYMYMYEHAYKFVCFIAMISTNIHLFVLYPIYITIYIHLLDLKLLGQDSIRQEHFHEYRQRITVWYHSN